jgi:hypothetical protein
MQVTPKSNEKIMEGLIIGAFKCREKNGVSECSKCVHWSFKEKDPFKNCPRLVEQEKMTKMSKEHHVMLDKLDLPENIMLQIFPPEKPSNRKAGPGRGNKNLFGSLSPTFPEEPNLDE